MAHCPSQDWDRYDNDREREAAEEIIFWRENKSDIAAIAGQMMTSPGFQKSTGEIGLLVERAELGPRPHAAVRQPVHQGLDVDPVRAQPTSHRPRADSRRRRCRSASAHAELTSVSRSNIDMHRCWSSTSLALFRS